ncbi:MAG: DUF3179 domain-containing protein [Bacteroidales bacterium]
MKRERFLLLAIVYMILFISMSCKKDDESPNNDEGQETPVSGAWLVPEDEIFDGGPGKDGIPALTNPQFTDPQEASYLSDNDLVLGFVQDGTARAYPHNILDWHEIVNDSYDDMYMAVIYCPLTGTGIGWDREPGPPSIAGDITSFGVSGLLYNSNIIPYDRGTDSNWSQMLLKAVNGELKGTRADTYNLIETRWDTWKSMYPETRVLSSETGHSRNYSRYPYGDYKTSNSLIFPVNNEDDRLHRKERVLGVLIEEEAKAYSIGNFDSSISLIHDNFKGEDLVIAGSGDKNFIVAFKREGDDGVSLEFTAVQDNLPVIMKDGEGTLYDVSGLAVGGPGEGKRLGAVTQFIGYWFAWAAFYPEIELY